MRLHCNCLIDLKKTKILYRLPFTLVSHDLYYFFCETNNGQFNRSIQSKCAKYAKTWPFKVVDVLFYNCRIFPRFNTLHI